MHKLSLWVVSPNNTATLDFVNHAIAKWEDEGTAVAGAVPLIQKQLDAAPLFARTAPLSCDDVDEDEDEEEDEDAGAGANTDTDISPGPGAGVGTDIDAASMCSGDDDGSNADEDDGEGAPKFHRLHACYNLPFLYFYERMNWNLMRCGPAVRHGVPAWVTSFALPVNVLGWRWFCWYWLPAWVIPVDFQWDGHRAATPPARSVAAAAHHTAATRCSDGQGPSAGFLKGALPPTTTCADVATALDRPVGSFDNPPSLLGVAAVATSLFIWEAAIRRGLIPAQKFVRSGLLALARMASAGKALRRLLYMGTGFACAWFTVIWQPPLANPRHVVVPFLLTVNVVAVGCVRLLAASRGDAVLPSVGSCWRITAASVRSRSWVLLPLRLPVLGAWSASLRAFGFIAAAL